MEQRLIDANALRERLLVLRNMDSWYITGKRDIANDRCISDIFDICLTEVNNAPTVEPNNEYGAIQYSNGFNDGFTTAKDTIIQNIATQYSEHNELVPIWLSIGDMKGSAE